jgi:Cytochrome c oxidase subunit IV
VSQEQKNHVTEDVSLVPAASPPPPPTAQAVEETEKAQEGQGPEGTASSVGSVDTASTTAAPAKKRSKRKTRLVNVEEISPHPSYWPILLAFSLALVLFGIVAGPIVVVVGVILAVVSAGGWILERR